MRTAADATTAVTVQAAHDPPSSDAIAEQELSFAAPQDVEDAGAASSRSVFVDLARAVAILMMLQGHTLDAVLAAELRTGDAFYAWSFVRGLASCIFFVVAGFVFSVATHRRWTEHCCWSATIARRFRRFGLFLLLGYALHFPMAKIAHLYGMSEERWRSFLIVDVLQCIAATLAILQVLVWVLRTPRRYTVGAAIGCAAIVGLTPVMWRIDWEYRLPLAIAAYLSPATGSLFPLFPWGAYILLGAVMGTLYVHVCARERRRDYIWLVGGGGMLGIGLVCAQLPLQPFGATEFWYTSPNLFFIRAGLILVVLGTLAHLSALVSKHTRVIQSIAQESLTIYAVHVCVVYGSVWNAGLRQRVGPTLTIVPALAYVATLCAAMILLALTWHWCKHREPGIAQWVRVGTGGVLLGRLL
jgi:acyltransferase